MPACPRALARSLVPAVLAAVLLVACAPPAPAPTPTPPLATPPPALPTGTPTRPPPTPPPALDPTFPFTLIDRLADPVEVTDIRDMDGVPQYRLLQDGAGTIHLLWGAREGLWHRTLGADGAWSAETQLLGDEYRECEGWFDARVDPWVDPRVYWLDAERVLHERSYRGGRWQPAQAAEVAASAIDDAPAIAGIRLAIDAEGRALYAYRAPGLGLYAGATRLADEPVAPTPDAYHLAFDAQNTAHVLYLDTAGRLYQRSSRDAGQTWSEPELWADLPDHLEELAFTERHGRVHVTWRSTADRALVHRLWTPGEAPGDERVLYDPQALYRRAEVTGDLRYLRVLDYAFAHPHPLDGHALAFAAATATQEIGYAEWASDGRWTVTRLVADGGLNPYLLRIADGTAHLLYRTADALYWVALKP